MNNYELADMIIGHEEFFAVEITSDMMHSFKSLSGDINPLHCNEDYAHKQGFPSCIVYGMLTSSFYSTLVGVYLPGKYCLLQSINVKMLAPVFVGDKLIVSGRVSEVREEVGIARIKAMIRNEGGVKVSKAVIQVGFLQATQADGK